MLRHHTRNVIRNPITTEHELIDRPKLMTITRQTTFTMSRHSSQPNVFLFFFHRTFFKNNFSQPQMAHLLLPHHPKPPSAKAKEPISNAIFNRISDYFILITKLKNAILSIPLFLFSTVVLAQTPPPLGTAADFVFFTSAGAISNGLFSQITGNIGTGAGAVTGFGNVNGQIHIGNATTIQCAIDLGIADANISGQIPGPTIGAVLGNGQVLLPDVYLLPAAASIAGTLILDGGGNPNACFVFQIGGALTTAAGTTVILTNGTQACNVFWKVVGAFSMAVNSSVKGTIISTAAITFAVGCSLEGRALTTAGAITGSSLTAGTPICSDSPILTGPLAPNLCIVGCFALLTSSGTISNTSTTNVVGDIGSNSGTVSGFNAAGVVGLIHPIPDAATAQASSDLSNLYTYLNGLPVDIELLAPVLFGKSQVLTPHVYIMNAAAMLTDTIFLDARGVAGAVFVIRVIGALTTNSNPQVVLVGGTEATNVFWQVEGAVTISSSGNFNGIIVANNGSIILNTGVVLSGGAFSTTGNITTQDANAIDGLTRYWTGAVDTDWFTTGNWCAPIIPNFGTNVYIPTAPAGGNFPSIGAPNAVCRNLTISTGASLGFVETHGLDVCGNWLNNGTVTPAAGGVTFVGTTKQTIGGTSANSFYNLTINNTSSTGVTLTNPKSVAGIFTLTDGLFYTTATNLLTLNSGSSVGAVSDNSFVSGPMAKVGTTNFTFPVGKDAKYRPISISTLTGSETFTAEYFHIDPNIIPYNVTSKEATLNNIGRCEYWMLNRTGVQNAFVTLSWDSYSCGVTVIADLAVARWDGAVWRDHGQSAPTGSPDPGTGTITTSVTVTSFSPFTLASTINNNPLPTELLSFTALAKDAYVQINWATASEINNNYFTIERSIDGINFETIATVDGAGNSSQILNYSAVDNAPLCGISYYRLKQTDYDGEFSYSSLVAVEFNNMNEFIFNIYPNPNNGEYINLQTPKNNPGVLIIVYDMLGNKIYSKVIIASINAHDVYTINPSQKLKPGVYLITATSSNKIYNKKLIVK